MTTEQLLDAAFNVAAVNAKSAPDWNLTAGIELAGTILAQAAADHIALVVFPELWLPGFVNDDSVPPPKNFMDYVDNAIEVGDDNWLALLRLGAEHRLHFSMSFAERLGSNLHMAQVLVGPDGTALSLRRKFKPSGGERRFFSDMPDHENLEVITTPLGRIGALSCGEHFKPQMTFPLMAQNENIHICAFPYNRVEPDGYDWSNDDHAWWLRYEMNETCAAYYSIVSGSWVVMASIGRLLIVDARGRVVARADNSDSNYAVARIDPTEFPPAAEGETNYHSWGVLQQMISSYPGPKEPHSFYSGLTKIDYAVL
ncbi:nitrilase-related carbon-nitrogen hydrolase [Pseudarthrobacter sp. NPDC058329]|uniref:nitrilase-related carbon-nitrogen hydrolase n=1 Tax=Pseudarthrobacter sp. NPDC058329 TaxID=3346448 RepID=UPI0036D8FDEA